MCRFLVVAQLDPSTQSVNPTKEVVAQGVIHQDARLQMASVIVDRLGTVPWRSVLFEDISLPKRLVI